MPPIRGRASTHDEELDGDGDEGMRDDVEDDDMPPLVEQPPPSMTYTFFTEMTPLSFDPSASTSGPELSLPPFTFSSVMDEGTPHPLPPPNQRTSHGKRRDASYIPRPPNAFILFRSSFIRSQQVTGNVEGNHSNLSKIIGMYWKTLPKAERDEWEAKAVQAQLEHRRRYPDWRFRPGSNALAKLKIKDGGGGAGPSKQRRIKDPPPDGGGGVSEDEAAEGELGKGKGKARSTRGRGRGKAREEADKGKGKAKSKEDTRFAKIADLLVEGKKGVELELAVKEWEGRKKATKQRTSSSRTHEEAGPSSRTLVEIPTPSSIAPSSNAPTPATNSPILSLATHSPMSAVSMWSAVSTPDTDDPPLRRLLPHGRSYPRYSRSRSRSPSRSRSRSKSPLRQEHAQAQAQAHEGSTPLNAYKRSLSAPASHHRLAYPHARVRPPVPMPSASLPLPVQPQSRRREGHIRHRASASVSFSMDQHQHLRASSPMGVDGDGDGGGFGVQTQTHTLSPLAQHPPVQRPTHAGGHGQEHGRRDTISFPVSGSGSPAYPHPHPYSPAQPQNLAQTQTHVQHTYYNPHLHPSPHRPTWQEEEARRRMEVEAGHALWWRPGSGGHTERGAGVGMYEHEPVREGSFAFAPGGDKDMGLGYREAEEGAGEGAMDRRYLQRFPPLPHGHGQEQEQELGTSGTDGLRWQAAAGRLGLVAPPIDDRGAFTHVPTHAHAHPQGESTPASPSVPHYGGASAEGTGGFFFPVPPTPISPFSSLAGWDGEAGRAGAGVGAVVDRSGGSEQAGGGGPWYGGAGGWGEVQDVGLRGGRGDEAHGGA